MPGNYTTFNNVTNLAILAQNMNIASGYLLGNLFVLTSFVVTYAVANRVGSEKALTVSSFITCIMAILLKLMSMISDWVLILTLIIGSIMITIQIVKNIE